MHYRSRAFTLMELLVVVVIIALLIAVLMPALTRARERSKRTVCLANVRSLGVMLRLYGEENDQAVLVGYQSGQRQLSYFLHNNDSSSGGWKSYWAQLGPLYLTGMITTPRNFYCPSMTNTAHQFNFRSNPANQNDNPWPPPIALSNPIRQNTRLAYSVRPTNGLLWPEPSSPGVAANVIFPSQRLPRFHELTPNLVILSDLIITPAHTDAGHKEGVNVLRSDTSGSWVPRAAFDGNLKQIPNGGTSSAQNNRILNDTSSQPSQWTGVWADLDRN